MKVSIPNGMGQSFRQRTRIALNAALTRFQSRTGWVSHFDKALVISSTTSQDVSFNPERDGSVISTGIEFNEKYSTCSFQSRTGWVSHFDIGSPELWPFAYHGFQSRTGWVSHFDGYPYSTAREAKKARVFRAPLKTRLFGAAKKGYICPVLPSHRLWSLPSTYAQMFQHCAARKAHQQCQRKPNVMIKVRPHHISAC
jgi:hypothetical protein